jgi:hypothetical protein
MLCLICRPLESYRSKAGGPAFVVELACPVRRSLKGGAVDLVLMPSRLRIEPKGGWQIGPLNPWHLFTEGHAGQRFLDAFPFDRVRGRAESVRQFVESAPFGFF